MKSSSPDGDYFHCIFSFVLNIALQAPTTGVLTAIVAALVLILCSAVISGSEVAFFSLTANEINQLKDESSKSARAIIQLLHKPRFLLATILIVNNLVNVGIVIISYFIFYNTIDFSEYPILGFLVNVLGVTFFLVIFGEVLPKVYATKFNLSLASFMAVPLYYMKWLFYPLSYLLVSSTKLIEKRLSKVANGEFNPEELEDAIDLTAGTKTSRQEVNMLKGIVKFGNTTVKQIMKSRMDIEAVDEEVGFRELLKIVKDSGYSRIPMYKETLDNITGVLYVKDLLEYLDAGPDFQWQKLVRQPVFAPETKKIDDLLKDIQTSRVHLVIAVDEYGGTSGLVTLEDILEEVIGDIKDEYDVLSEIEFEKIDKKNYVFEGKTLLKDICKVLDIKDDIFDGVRGDADSLAGLLLELAGKFPEKGEELNFDRFSFKVMSVGDNRIKRVKVTINDDVFSE